MSQNREFELKFLIADDDISKLISHPALVDAVERNSEGLNASYFDTPDLELQRQGISLRVRDSGGRKKQTLKQRGGPMLDRGEWEADAEGSTPSLEWIAGTPLRRAFRHGVGEHLAPIFTVAVERRTLDVTLGSAAIEVAIDKGEIQAGGRVLPVHEIEFELKRGETSALFRLARELVADKPLMLSLISKAERGYRLLDGSWGHPAKAPLARLAPDMSNAEAIQAIVESCLHEMMLNIEAFAAGPDDIETVHLSRVALRRLRAAMTLFKPILQDEQFEHLHDDLKWMSDLLGTARDLDIFQSETFDPAAHDPQFLGGHELAQHMRGKQQDAHAALAEALVSRRWQLVVMDLTAWLYLGAWRKKEEADQPVPSFIVRRLRKRRKQVVSVGADLARLAPEERHKVRIQAKKLRYALEFFEATPGIGKGSKRFRAVQAGLEELQSALGKMHDDEAKQDLLRAETFTWQGSDNSDERATFAAGLLAGAGPDRDALLADALKALKKVKKNKPF